jgi:hypothetical protein
MKLSTERLVKSRAATGIIKFRKEIRISHDASRTHRDYPVRSIFTPQNLLPFNKTFKVDGRVRGDRLAGAIDLTQYIEIRYITRYYTNI